MIAEQRKVLSPNPAVMITGSSASSGCQQLRSEADAEDTQASGEAWRPLGFSSSAVLSAQQGSSTARDQGSVPRSGCADDCVQPSSPWHAVW